MGGTAGSGCLPFGTITPAPPQMQKKRDYQIQIGDPEWRCCKWFGLFMRCTQQSQHMATCKLVKSIEYYGHGLTLEYDKTNLWTAALRSRGLRTMCNHQPRCHIHSCAQWPANLLVSTIQCFAKPIVFFVVLVLKSHPTDFEEKKSVIWNIFCGLPKKKTSKSSCPALGFGIPA
jgi:hypothetical protein